MNTADTMQDFCQYYRCFLQILMSEQTHWLGLLRLLWQILWDNSSLSILLFIQNCKPYLSNETCVYWCNDFKYHIKHKISGPFDLIIFCQNLIQARKIKENLSIFSRKQIYFNINYLIFLYKKVQNLIPTGTRLAW